MTVELDRLAVSPGGSLRSGKREQTVRQARPESAPAGTPRSFALFPAVLAADDEIAIGGDTTTA